MKNLETKRLILVEFSLDDAPFIMEMLNDPAWIEFIGDRRIRTLDDARDYIVNKLQQTMQESGYGMLLVKLKDGSPIGTCGLLKREYLDDYDIGFAFLPNFRRKGYAYEAASAMIDYGKESLGLKRIAAFVLKGNLKSVLLLKKLGMKYERMLKIPNDDAEIELYGKVL
ncbi:MAG: GNAT family N-acetyltransferase [Anaerolineae bacterium]|jgi:RimJ/RimL family protein N-acetyltransferase|nr:GNAT family N-acetyltransferase [Anaerolineae bacterium]MBT7075588.1 GNAT family N-acetyltransferase [Anaerolineae bacterium]MBT7782393.1 GNAT family N-acetyltransferase [Anaerolineae bacterium]